MKKFLSLVLAIVLSISSYTIASATTSTGNGADILSNYDIHKIILTEKGRPLNLDNTSTAVDRAVAYVKSLNLPASGYEYIEEACLSELETYRENGVTLDTYSVLTPNARASDVLFGTYSGQKFYIATTSLADIRVEKDGSSPSSTVLRNWVDGLFSVVVGYAGAQMSLLYSMAEAGLGATGNVSFYSGTHNEYVFQVSPTTRTIYTYSGSNKKTVYADQRGTADIRCYFCPVGSNFTNDYVLMSSKNDQVVRTQEYTDSNRILQRSYQMYTHNGFESWSLVNELLSESWG